MFGLIALFYLYNFIKSVQYMSEGGKRSLRERRVPKNFDSDNEDPDPYGYGRYPYTKDMRSVPQLINSEAKLFMKFINNANKKAKDYQLLQARKDVDKIKEPEPIRERRTHQNDSSSEAQRRLADPAALRLDASKKPKDTFNFKVANLPKKNEAFFNQMKTLAMQSATSMRLLQMSMGTKKPESSQLLPQKPPEFAPNYKKTEKLAFGKSLPIYQSSKPQPIQPTEQTKNGGFFTKDKEKARQLNELQEKLGLKRTDFTTENNKIFKRAAYHVAIAYHIYLKKLKEKGPLGTDIDPTMHARRLKEDMSRNH